MDEEADLRDRADIYPSRGAHTPTADPRAAPARSTLVPALMSGTIVALVILIAIVVVFVRGDEEAGDDEATGSYQEVDAKVDPTNATTSTQPSPRRTDPRRVPSTRPPETQPPTTPPPPVSRLATVNRTCGAEGTGDCFVALRREPTTAAAKLGELTEGTTVDVVCQEWGEDVYSSVLDTTSSVWVRSTDGAYMAGIFLDVPGWSLDRLTQPC